MNCNKCKQKNIKKANYCKYCGNEFSEKEKEIAKNKGFIATIKRMEKWYNRLTLKVITNSKIFKVLVVLVMVCLGIWNLSKENVTFHILENDSYKVKYNEIKDEYYITLNNNDTKIKLDLYLPNQVNNIEVIKYDENNNEISRIIYNKDNEINVYANTIDNSYYLLKDDVKNDKDLKIYVYLNEEEV